MTRKDHDRKLIRPPFLKEKVQFTGEEPLLNIEIMKTRIYTERSNERLKTFAV